MRVRSVVFVSYFKERENRTKVTREENRASCFSSFSVSCNFSGIRGCFLFCVLVNPHSLQLLFKCLEFLMHRMPLSSREFISRSPISQLFRWSRALHWASGVKAQVCVLHPTPWLPIYSCRGDLLSHENRKEKRKKMRKERNTEKWHEVMMSTFLASISGFPFFRKTLKRPRNTETDSLEMLELLNSSQLFYINTKHPVN